MVKRILMVMAAALMMCVLTGVSAQATVWYVDGVDGLDSNAGLAWASAFKTIGKAVEIATAGDTIYVLQGSYYESIVTKANTPITIEGVGEVLLDGRGSLEVAIRSRSNNTFRNLTIQHYWLRTMYGGVLNSNAGIVVDNCVFRWNKNVAPYYGVVYLADTGTFTRCLFLRNEVVTAHTSVMHFAGSGAGSVVDKCTFYENVFSGHITYGACVTTNQQITSILNCSFYNNRDIFYNDVIGVNSLNYPAAIENCNFYSIYPGKHIAGLFLPQFQTNITYLNPLHVLVNDRPYLRVNSPLVLAGTVVNGRLQDIGAFGVADIHSETVSHWAGWIEDGTGLPITDPGAAVALNDSGYIKLQTGVMEARIVSPEIKTNTTLGHIKSIWYASNEVANLTSGERQVIDGDTTTRPFEVYYRLDYVDDNDASTWSLDWTPYTKGTIIDQQAQVIQIRLTLRRNGN